MIIDKVYSTLQTIVSKEHAGYLTPVEFNNVAKLVQDEIFRGYFEDINRDDNKANRGLTNKGYGNLGHNERQRLSKFSTEAVMALEKPSEADFALAVIPEDVYLIDDNGIMAGDGRVVEEVDKSVFGFAAKSISTFSTMFPISLRRDNTLKVFPQATASPLSISYIRKPKAPKWTYRVIGGNPLFDPSSPSFQDFELHESEFAKIVVMMLTYFGINLREAQVIQVAEQLKGNISQKDNA